MSNVYFHDRLCCAAMWASMVSTPTCDFRCWQAAWRLKGFRWFQGSQVWGMNPDRCWQKFVTKLQNELIKGMEKRVRIVIKVCRDFAWWSYLVRRLPQSWACFPYTFFKRLPPQKKTKTDFLPSVESLLLRRGVAIPQSIFGSYWLVNWVPEKHASQSRNGPPTRPYRQLGCDISQGK